jgi:hypothetical protein
VTFLKKIIGKNKKGAIIKRIFFFTGVFIIMKDQTSLGNYSPPLEGIPDPNASNPSQPFESIHGNNRLLQFPDGSAAIEEATNLPRKQTDSHFQNLADVLTEIEIKQIGFELKEAVEEDISSQETYLQALADVIKLLGLNLDGDREKEDLPFEGASGICSTALFESLLDMLATATTSLYPPTGMVDCVINGEVTQELQDKAYRKKLFFNYYLTQVAHEFKKEGRRALTWAILAGSCYKKVYIDPLLQRPTSQFIRPEDFIVNTQYATHLSAPRKTHIIRMSGKEIKIRMMNGQYRDDETLIKVNTQQEERGEIQEALDEISGRERTNYSITLDQEYTLYEIHAEYFIQGDKRAPHYDLPMPYIITLDANSGYVLSIIRNWDKNDFLRKKKEYFVNYSLFPALEGEGYGLVHYAGGLAEAATAIKRQLINTGTYANFPGGVYSAGIRLENNNIRPSPGEFIPIQAGGEAIDKVLTALPYKEPSPTLGTLLTSIEDSIKKPSAIVNQKVADMTPQAPVGSVLAMLESLQKVPNAILEGFHESFGQELMLFNDRFGEWLPPNVPYPFKVPGGQHEIMKQDFDEDIKIIPASNPSLQNSSYRFMQSEIILTQARQSPDIHNMWYAYEYFYKNLGLSPEDIQQLLPPPPQQAPPPFSGDPVTENTYLMTNKPVRASIAQDHASHRMVHQLILANPQVDPTIAAAVKAHDQEHEALEFLVDMQARMNIQLPQDPSQIPPEVQNQIAVQAAQVAQQKLQELQAAQQPPQPQIDPTVAAIEIENIRTQQRRESDLNKIELEKMKLTLQENKFKTESVLAEMKLQQDREREFLKEQWATRREELKLQQEKESELLRAQLEEKKLDIENAREERERIEEQLQRINTATLPSQE